MSGKRFKGAMGFGAKTIGGIAVVFLLVGGLAVFMTPRQAKVTSVAAAAPVSQAPVVQPIEVSGGELTRDRAGAQWYSGTVINNTSKEVGFLRISYDLFDATGNHLGTAMASTTRLQPYGKWMFKTGIDDKCTEVKLAKLDW